MDKETLEKINSEVQAILDKYNVTLQPTMGITYVALAPKEDIIKEAEIISPYKDDEPNQTPA